MTAGQPVSKWPLEPWLLRQLYEREKMSVRQICDYILEKLDERVSDSKIARLLRLAGVTLRTRSENAVVRYSDPKQRSMLRQNGYKTQAKRTGDMPKFGRSLSADEARKIGKKGAAVKSEAHARRRVTQECDCYDCEVVISIAPYRLKRSRWHFCSKRCCSKHYRYLKLIGSGSGPMRQLMSAIEGRSV